MGLIIISPILKDTIFYALSKSIPGLIGFSAIIIFMNILGAEKYGEYSLIISRCNLIVALSFGWLNQAKLRYYSIDRESDNYNYSQIIALFYSTIFLYTTHLLFFEL